MWGRVGGDRNGLTKTEITATIFLKIRIALAGARRPARGVLAIEERPKRRGRAATLGVEFRKAGNFFNFLARNPLKSPDSEK